ncbi:MAG TPA: glycosyltransferase family 39 protein [Armatimonadota bacterium]|nr:glycosyltransferase family 39 protein [Armatimonadota bacterium]
MKCQPGGRRLARQSTRPSDVSGAGGRLTDMRHVTSAYPVDYREGRSTGIETAGRLRPAACRWLLFVFLLGISAFRFWYSSTHGLFTDEAYYWLWARHPAPGYYDQGPGVALVIRFGLLFGSSAGAVRVPAVLDAVLSSLAAYLLASRIFRSEQAGLFAGVFLNVVPLLFVGGILMTHDSPQMASWAFGVYCAARAVGIGDAKRAQSNSLRFWTVPAPAWWILAGILGGFSVDCKYTAILFFPCLLLFLLVSPQARPALRTPWPYLSAICGAIMVIPAVYWNATHEWASARHILNLGGAHNPNLLDTHAVGDYIGGQLAVALLFLFTMGWASVKAWSKGRRDRDPGLLLAACFSWPVWALFLLLSFHDRVEANWPVPAYFTAVVAAPWLAACAIYSARNGWKGAQILFHVISILLAGAALTVILFSNVLRAFPHGSQLADRYRKGDRTNEMFGWNQLAEGLSQAGWKPGGRWLPAAIRYQDAAELSFVLPGQPTTYDLPVKRRRCQYDFWPAMPYGSDALVAVPEPNGTDVELQLAALFNRVAAGPRIPLWRRPLYRLPIGRYIIFRCEGYHGGREGLMGNQW